MAGRRKNEIESERGRERKRCGQRKHKYLYWMGSVLDGSVVFISYE